MKLSKYVNTAKAVAILAALFLTTGCAPNTTDSNDASGTAGRPQPSAAPVAVRVQQPEYRTLERRISYVGTVFAGQEVPIIARVQGTLVELPVREGQSFVRGTVLARLDSPEMEAAVERLRAEVDYWSSRNETDRRLVEQGALAPEQADSSERALRTARAGLDEATAQLAKTVVTAPFDGNVLDWPAEIGQPVMPGQPLILIGDASREVRTDVVEEDLQRGIREGTPMELSLAPDRILSSAVTSVAPASSGPARTFTVTVAIPVAGDPSSATELPRKGSSIRADFIVDRRESTLAVPLRAVADRDGAAHLFVVTEDTAHQRSVTPGISQGGWIAVDFDWNGADPVAVTNLNTLRDGASVYAVSADAANIAGQGGN